MSMKVKQHPKILKAWTARSRLHAEGDKLHAEGHKLHVEAHKLCAKGDKLHAEGDLIFISQIIETYGNIDMEWKTTSECHLGNGEVYK